MSSQRPCVFCPSPYLLSVPSNVDPVASRSTVSGPWAPKCECVGVVMMCLLRFALLPLVCCIRPAMASPAEFEPQWVCSSVEWRAPSVMCRVLAVAEWVLVLSACACIVGAPAGRPVPLAVARRTGGWKRSQGPGGGLGLPGGARRWLPEGQSGGQRIPGLRRGRVFEGADS